MRRVLWWVALVAGVAMLAGGAVVGYLGYRQSDGPDGAVRGYFAALQAGDAPRALAWGDVPDGPHALLTSAVLRAQQRVAPIRDVRIGRTTQHGARATVAVTYMLGFADANVSQHATLGLVRRDGDWRLRATAVATQILVENAADRATVLGGTVPASETLVFPGALPVTFDSPYLQLQPDNDVASFGGGPVAQVGTELSARGRSTVLAAVTTGLLRCLAGSADVTCPVPSSRYVPGTLRGTANEADISDLQITLGQSQDGLIEVNGHVSVDGRYRELTFANRAVAGHGTVEIQVHARAYAVTPLVLRWTSS